MKSDRLRDPTLGILVYSSTVCSSLAPPTVCAPATIQKRILVRRVQHYRARKKWKSYSLPSISFSAAASCDINFYSRTERKILHGL